VQELLALEELDFSYNCLLSHHALQPIKSLTRLRVVKSLDAISYNLIRTNELELRNAGFKNKNELSIICFFFQLDLSGNPLSMHRSHRALSLKFVNNACYDRVSLSLVAFWQ
jgi:hypothetical protein